MSTWYLVFGLACTFFIIIPGAGAVSVRRRWRRFRRALVRAALAPTVTYSALSHLRRAAGGGGRYRFFGRLEAIEDDDVIWLNDGAISVAADVARTTAYLLPSTGSRQQPSRPVSEESPDRVPWSRLTTLPERTPVFVAGELRLEGDRPVFRAEAPGDELLLILYDGPGEDVLQHSVWTGRQRNEYWNLLTPASLAVGSLALLLAAYILLRIPADRSAAILAVSCALIPILPLLPPGFISFPLYRRMWRRGRYLRAERDILRLPLRHDFDARGETLLPDRERYVMRTVDRVAAGELVHAGAQRLDVSVAEAEAEEGREGEGRRYFVFGTPDAAPARAATSDAAGLRKPGDPMAGLLVLPGEPSRLARRSERAAQLFEISAVAILLAGTGINFYIALLLVSRVMF
ncbi:MAG: hypothetical protein GVY14_06065 [Spirochaetes bacterium]|jgi:hypothetical protein|nr:hypothetical protein [Spirochaetota bacterium]